MNVLDEIEINRKKYYFMEEYVIEGVGKIYEFANLTEDIYCYYENEKFEIIKDKKVLKKIDAFFGDLSGDVI